MSRDRDHCILCGAQLPPDRRWWVTRVLLQPRFPRCNPSEECFRGLARRMGGEPSDEAVCAAVQQAKQRRR